MIFSDYFGFLLPVSSYRFSIRIHSSINNITLLVTDSVDEQGALKTEILCEGAGEFGCVCTCVYVCVCVCVCVRARACVYLCLSGSQFNIWISWSIAKKLDVKSKQWWQSQRPHFWHHTMSIINNKRNYGEETSLTTPIWVSSNDALWITDLQKSYASVRVVQVWNTKY